ncbi:MAG TPA: aldehyde dehydrogenase family protein [Steroidobacteraceae bacterium]|jgi:phenylacetaldehyde dehydrogenase|nr:aldehyde dehydrogenase family protein [Steroidobacteraceae bacterium]
MDADAQAAALKKALNFAASRHRLLIGGVWRDAQSGRSFDTFNPATKEKLASVAAADAADVDLAVRAARTALEGPLAAQKASERAKLLWKLADLVEAHADEFAVLETLDNGKPLRESRYFDIPHTIEVIRYNAGWCTKLTGETIALSNPGNWHAYTVREPVGVVAQIVPWNSPLAMAATKIAPALAAGCAVILKPAEQTPLTALRLAHLVLEVGFPEGAFNLLTGTGEEAGAALTAHAGVDKVTFTGSTEVGRAILHAAAGNFKRVTLELGGKTPVIVLPDADVEKVAMGAARSIFTNAGQICNAGSRLYADARVFDELVARVADYADKIVLGSGLEPTTQMGPVVSEEQQRRVEGYVASGLEQGATRITKRTTANADGYFVQPTVLTNTTESMRVVREEIFGPVLCAMRFEEGDLAKVADMANAGNYGLGAVVWTNNLAAAHQLVRRLKAGTVRVNGGGLDPALPFGGFKQSGWGRENGRAGIEAYTELKSVAMAF